MLVGEKCRQKSVQRPCGVRTGLWLAVLQELLATHRHLWEGLQDGTAAHYSWALSVQASSCDVR